MKIKALLVILANAMGLVFALALLFLPDWSLLLTR